MKIVIDGLCNPSLLEWEIPFGVPEPELIFYQQHFDAFILRTFLYLTILSEIVLSQFFDQFPEVMPVAVQHSYLMTLLHPFPRNVMDGRSIPQQIVTLWMRIKCCDDQDVHLSLPQP